MATKALEDIAQALMHESKNMTLENCDYDFDSFDFASDSLLEVLELLESEKGADNNVLNELHITWERVNECRDLCDRVWNERVSRMLNRSSSKYKIGGVVTVLDFASAVMRKTSKMKPENLDYDSNDYSYARRVLLTVSSSAVACGADDESLTAMFAELDRLDECINECSERWEKEREARYWQYTGNEKIRIDAHIPEGVGGGLLNKISEEMKQFQSRLNDLLEEATPKT